MRLSCMSEIVTSTSRFCITVALEVGLTKSPFVVGLVKLETTGRRDPGQPFTADDDVSVNRELHACGFYASNRNYDKLIMCSCV